ncbi:MAG: hypothetical protein Q4F84_03415, partial [Fibrobacter sp.]|nr:hypothetical protein [Fibrobacter sp.]
NGSILAQDAIRFKCENQNVIFCGIDGTGTRAWLTNPLYAHRDPSTPSTPWNSHVRNLYDDINVKYSGYFFGPENEEIASDSDDIHDEVLRWVQSMHAASNKTAKIVLVGFSRGAMIAQWVANDISKDHIDVEFVGLYDPVDMAASIPDENGCIEPNVKNVMIVGPVSFTGQPLFNPDYWTSDFDSISTTNGPFIRMSMYGRLTTSSGATTVVDRFELNASHGAIGGLPGYNDQSENTVDARTDAECTIENMFARKYTTSYSYSLDIASSFHADYRMRTKCVDLGIYIRVLEFDDYRFPSTNPVYSP